MRDKNKTVKNISLVFSIFITIFIVRGLEDTKQPVLKTNVKRTPSSVSFLFSKTAELKDNIKQRSKNVKKKENKFLNLKNDIGTVKAYQKMVKYPSYSTPISSNQSTDFIDNQLLPDIKMAIGERNSLIQFKAWSDKNFYNQKEKIKINALLTLRGRVKQSRVFAEFSSGVKEELVLRPDGQYELVVDSELIVSGKNTIKILTTYQNESFIMLSRFNYSESNIELLDKREIKLDSQGNLVFHNDAKIQAEGNYLVEGILYHKGKMIAKAHSIQLFTKGINRVDLKYYGYLFYEQEMSGEFELRNLQISLIDENLNSQSTEFFTPLSKTAHIQWDQFNSSPFNNELIQNKILALE